MTAPTPEADFLLGLAEECNPPQGHPVNDSATMEFVTAGGWTVVFFYDAGDLDYIEKFISPEGDEVDFWAWPEDHAGREAMIAWRGVGDLNRLRQEGKIP